MTQDRRRHARTETRIDVTLRVVFAHQLDNEGIAYAGLMLDYSDSGARISTAANGHGRRLSERLAQETALVVCEIDVPGAPTPLRLAGEVRWSRLGGQRRDLEVGLRFFGENKRDLAVIDKLTTGQAVVERPSTRLGWLAALAVFIVATGWVWAERSTHAAQAERLRGDLQAAEETHQTALKRAKQGEDRVRELESKIATLSAALEATPATPAQAQAQVQAKEQPSPETEAGGEDTHSP